jgi:hypothetical protein
VLFLDRLPKGSVALLCPEMACTSIFPAMSALIGSILALGCKSHAFTSLFRYLDEAALKKKFADAVNPDGDSKVLKVASFPYRSMSFSSPPTL